MQGRIAQESSRGGENITDSNSPNERVCPTNAVTAATEKYRFRREFSREILQEVRVKGNAVRLTYKKLPMTMRTLLRENGNSRTGEFFTLYQLVEQPIATHKWGKLALMADPFGHGFCFVQFVGRGYDEIAE